MKKVILLSILFLFSLNINSQIKLRSYIDAGYYNGRIRIVDNEKIYQSLWLQNRMYSEVFFGVSLSNLELSTNITTYIQPRTVIRYDPLQSDYKLNISYNIKSIQVHYEHLCTHSTQLVMINGGYDKIGIRLTIAK